MTRIPSVRLGYQLQDRLMTELANQTLDDRAYDVLLTGGPYLVRMPDARPLACYLPGVLRGVMDEVGAYSILHPLYTLMTNNRGQASGSPRIRRGTGEGTRSDALVVSSPFLGSVDPAGVYRYCRLTAWTGDHLPEYQALAPFFRVIARYFEEYVPERYNAQMEYVRKTDAAWVVPGTPFTTITVNNSYSTGVHKDRGDLEEGFSALACIRRGEYEGGVLVFPQYRVGVDMHDGDLLLMDAHQWHGNTRMTCACGERILNRFCLTCGAERISIVCYYRTQMAECGSPEEENEKAGANTEKRSQPRAAAAADAAAALAPVTVPEQTAAAPDPADTGPVAGTPAEIVKEPEPEPEPEPAVRKRGRGRPRKNENRNAAVRVSINPETGEPLEG